MMMAYCPPRTKHEAGQELAREEINSLEALNLAVRAREEWYGRKFSLWCDQEMGNTVMDVEAAEAIAKIIDDVRRNQADKQSYDDLISFRS